VSASPISGRSGSDALTAAEFQDEVRLSARLDRPLVIEDPLAAALEQIQQHPFFAQSRLLARILTALTYSEGSFRRAEIASFDLPTRGLVVALIAECAECAEGGAPREAWVKAVTAANAAQLAAEA
jgi:hypothetical protein